VDSTPSGPHVRSRPGDADITEHIILKGVRRWLAEHLASQALPETAEAVGLDRGDAQWPDVFQAICFELTAYTHLRRLLVLRQLCECRHSDLEALREKIGMSSTAAQRQVDKLRRRGIVEVARDGRRLVVQLPATLDTPFRSALFDLLREQLSRS